MLCVFYHSKKKKKKSKAYTPWPLNTDLLCIIFFFLQSLTHTNFIPAGAPQNQWIPACYAINGPVSATSAK